MVGAETPMIGDVELGQTEMAVTEPSREEAASLAGSYRLIPVHRELPADLLTPVRVYLLLCRPEDPGFLLESVTGGEQLARYSFVGYRPRPLELGDGDPLRRLAEVLGGAPAPHPGLPRLIGGAVGYLGYEAARHFERLPSPAGSPPPMPESAFLLAENLAIIDHLRQRLRLLTMHRPAEESYDDAVRRLDEMERLLSVDKLPSTPLPTPGEGPATWTSNTTQAQYEAMVRICKDHIFAGDAFQVVPSQRFRKRCDARPFDIYRALRSVNPSPYLYYLNLGKGRHIAGSSPEVLVSIEDGTVTVRPLAGTRRRGRTAEEDESLELELREDPKERAEHVMLVDLGRNDVGRIAVPGSVHVEDLLHVERYSHVMHLSSTVKGRLAAEATSLDAIRAAFPAGTVSGAPKIRAMEIIAEVEPERRGVYSGAFGYIGYDGNVDLAIALRTVIIADGVAYVQAGAGVVADSDPAREYQETLEKAGAMFRAIEIAEANR
ncbi:MAG: chorismate-binding protein [Candidatus Dormiibacterota bacterium]